MGTPTRTRLIVGQALRLHADSGTNILATEGSISITEAPIWLSDQFLHHSTTLRESELYVVQASGWITVSAHGPAEVWYQQPDPYPFAALLARLFSSA
ncbi:MAG: hypothetical protein HHJ09_08060 [Glaciimonas sp.]|nr:hypothetical protein [Glaciimonas sp.]